MVNLNWGNLFYYNNKLINLCLKNKKNSELYFTKEFERIDLDNLRRSSKFFIFN